MTSKLTEAIRVLRDYPDSEQHACDAFAAIASALEELSGKGDVGGEVGESTPAPFTPFARKEASRLVTLCEPDATRRHETFMALHRAYERGQADGARHFSETHEVECPRRETIRQAEQRAEAAEAQLSELKRQLGAERVRLNDTREAINNALPESLQLLPNELWQGLPARVARLTAELEAARARVGELEAEGTAVQLVVNALSSGGHPVVSAASIAGGGVALTSRKGDRSARIEVEGREIVLTTQAGDEPPNYRELDAATAAREALRFLHSTPSAPTPAVVDSAHSAHACPVCFKEPVSLGVTYADGCEKHQESIALDVAKAKKVAPPGLTPEDAEDGHLLPAHRELERIWDEADDPDDFHPHRTAKEALWLAGYERGHSEGAKAAKAKGGKVAEFFDRFGVYVENLLATEYARNGVGGLTLEKFKELREELRAR